MDCSNSCTEGEPCRGLKNPFGDIDKSVQFWGEARGESRKISTARLKCAPHSEQAESMALAIWEQMTPEHYRLVSEIERLLTTYDEIRVAVLRETLGQIFESLNVDVKDLRAINPVPIEALTLLLNHIIKIYNMSDADVQMAEELVPLSERIKEQASRAEKHGFGSITVSKNMYASERAKLAMLQTQLLGRLKLKSGTGAKFQSEWRKLKYKLESKKKDDAKRKFRHVLEIKRKLKDAQETLGGNKIRGIKTKLGRYHSRLLRTESYVKSSSNHSMSSTNPEDNRFDSCSSSYPDTNDDSNDEDAQKASIDTSSWVISPTHEYYFGCSPPVIPKTTVTHEVYPKPVETKMEPLKDAKDVPGDWEISREPSKSVDLEPYVSAVLGSETGLMPRYVSTTSSGSYTNVDDREPTNYDESHGDASTIFAWTEPEKSTSYCLNTGEKTVDSVVDDAGPEGVSDAAGDGCDLARTLEESNMDVLKTEEDSREFNSIHEDLPEVPPPRPFSMTDMFDKDYSSNESMGFHNRNMFSCNAVPFVRESSETVIVQAYESEENNVKVDDESTGNSPEVVDEAEGNRQPEKDTNDEDTEDGERDRIFDTPPAEPNDEKIDGSKKCPSGVQMMNKSVMDELTDVLKRTPHTEEAVDHDVVVMASVAATTSEERNDTKLIHSRGDSFILSTDESRSEFSSSFTIPVPPPMPPPPRECDDYYGFPYYGDARPRQSADDFQSVTDFRGTQVLYMRPPPAARTRPGKKCIPQRGSVNREENESDENQTNEAPSGRGSTPGKRNDMVTLAVLAFAVGIGTLGYMTMAATGSNLVPEVLGAAGGRALNVIEKALQVLKSLNNRL